MQVQRMELVTFTLQWQIPVLFLVKIIPAGACNNRQTLIPAKAAKTNVALQVVPMAVRDVSLRKS